jgi:hypothetical protein
MNTNQEVVQKLREIMKSGATVSRLLREIQATTNRPISRSELIGLFTHAFEIGPAGVQIIRESESFGTGRRPDADMNLCFLPRIMENRHLWDADFDRHDNEPRWYDSANISSNNNLAKAADAERCGFSEATWAAMTESDRLHARSIETERISSSELVILFSNLLECLQKKIDLLAGEVSQ